MRNVSSLSSRLSTEPQIMLASSQTTSSAWESDTSISSLPRKPAPTTRASFNGTLTRHPPEGLPSKCSSAVHERAAASGTVSSLPAEVRSLTLAVRCPAPMPAGAAPSPLASTLVKHIVSRTSSTAAANPTWISFGSIDHRQTAFQFFPQGLRCKGLGDIALGPQREHFLHATFGAVRRSPQDRDQPQHRVFGHPPQQLFAVHRRHVDIGEHRVHPVVFEHPQRLFAVRGLQAEPDLQAGQLQDAANERAHHRGIVHDQYTEFHQRPPFPVDDGIISRSSIPGPRIQKRPVATSSRTVREGFPPTSSAWTMTPAFQRILRSATRLRFPMLNTPCSSMTCAPPTTLTTRRRFSAPSP